MLRAHDVAACLLPCHGGCAGSTPAGRSQNQIRVWESLEIRLLREQKIVGSTPTTLTKSSPQRQPWSDANAKLPR
jgi:hypothetical protein